MKIILMFSIMLLVIVAWIVSIYNKLIRLIETVNNNKSQIDLQLDRRYKVYESLIELVKKYMDYEKTTLKEVVALRATAQEAAMHGNEQAKIRAEEEISKIGSSLNVVFEQYPQLQADKNILQLQEEVVNTENKLTFAKQAYNDSIEIYYAMRKSLFESVIVGMFPEKLLKEFLYWGLGSATQREQLENYKVQF